MKIYLILFTLFSMSSTVLSQTQLVIVNDDERQVTIYSSSRIEADTKVPLLLNFHGYGMTALEQMMYSETNKLAEEHGFIVAYPQGKNNDWNVGFGMEYDAGNDVEFVQTLLQNIVELYPVDSTKIYAIGISRGGFFVQRLAAELPDHFSGFVSVGAPLPLEVHQRMSDPLQPKALFVHGTADQIVDITGKEGAYFSLDKTLELWKGNQGKLTATLIQHYKTNDEHIIVAILYYNDNATLASMIIEQGGHTWPGADPFNVGLPLGNTAQGFDFNTFFWEFLSN